MVLLYQSYTYIIQELARELGNGAQSGTLAIDSRNIVEVVRELYNVSYDV